ncbi:uncharacterized protein BO72DRAFT_431620 [Aspergillus fijiensis CBS 313.89]|uniref:Zn(2)-C6 fungal-type domain-containing protein n=1 Tax=Aspergillus fijiensis CBS 313.89 TaxID=1448319 RepID=A0A8G1RNU5_9EURO|nr:uncharacterized protein BO72DRAFT_431620 [Aspergillus fijiensis CBS 313.89]RAK76154.1 hypothetical protein BO72DRAFT_431620 [Aspergillus fijiensis CBS 313.89]
MTMDSTSTAERRRRRRRVADVDRKRAPRACTLCKRRKSKCIPARGNPRMDAHHKCQRCTLRNLDCKFEKGDSPGTESSLTQVPAQSPSAAIDSTRRLPDHASIDHSELLSPASVLSQGLSTHVIADQSKRVLWPNFLSRLREAFSLGPHHAPEEREMVAMQARMIQPKGLHPSELSRLQAAIDAFPPRPVADFLLHVFMKHATDVFFYFDQAQMLADVDEFYTDLDSPLRFDSAFVCLAMATFALGSQWTPLEKPAGFEPSLLPKENVELGHRFAAHAKTLIPDIIERSCLRSVQAPFVLGVYFMPASALGTSYVYLGLALRKALACDLHLNSEDLSMTERDIEVRCRLWWSIYALERCTTVKLNRPRSTDTRIITVAYPSQNAVLDRAQSFENLDCQLAYVRLVRILDEIAGPADGLPSSADISQSTWKDDLKAWKRSLPPNLKLDQIPPSSWKYRAIAHLYLNYCYAMITMGKVALVTLARTKLKPPADCDAPEISDKVESLANGCTKAARKILRLFESLTRHRVITRFSFTDFQGCSIATIVTLVSGILERDSGYDSRVELGFNCLRKMATGNMTAKLGVSFVEAVQSITNEAASKLQQRDNPAMSRGAPDLDAHLGYNQWLEWFAVQEDSKSRECCGIGQREEVPDSRDRDAESWLAVPATWQTPMEQHIPEATSIPEGYSNPSSGSSCPLLPNDFFSGLHNDEQSFLMGLTGLDALGDALDFSGLMGQME